MTWLPLPVPRNMLVGAPVTLVHVCPASNDIFHAVGDEPCHMSSAPACGKTTPPQVDQDGKFAKAFTVDPLSATQNLL